MARPLTGIHVVEVANYMTGPYAGQLLADLGADVIKVEQPPHGDPFRIAGEKGYGDLRPSFISQNRGKRSILVNLKSSQGQALLHELIRRADVVIQNMRPGVADRLGFGYERAKELRPDVIYCSVSGFGTTGPYAHKPSYNEIGQAVTGMISLMTDREQPRLVGPGLSDVATGIFASHAILAALYARATTGRGEHIELSQMEATLSLIPSPLTQALAGEEPENPQDRPKVSQSYVFKCSDGHAIVVHLSSPTKFWQGLVTAAGRPDMIDDQRFQTKQSRVVHYDVIQAELDPIFATKTRAEWLAILDHADIPSAPLYLMPEVLEDPQIKHLQVEQTAMHPELGPIRLGRYPARFGSRMMNGSKAPPLAGEDTAGILAELGYSAEQIEELRAAEAIG